MFCSLFLPVWMTPPPAPGESITLKCSPEECPQNSGRYVGMYLYHRFTEQNEVYFYSNHVNSKVTVRSRYKGRIESNGAPMNHSITMTNLTVDDSGVYTCVYKESVDKSAECKVYTVFFGIQAEELGTVLSRLEPTALKPVYTFQNRWCQMYKLSVPQALMHPH
uniref:Ig-like domain-containing protein n=1 Tax=Neolamprologus brichardi TaxID=32507 RepID=A0A3Q4M218_NEOBR